MPTPVSISAFPVRGYSIAKDVVCVNALVQSPLVVAGRPLNAWEGYNYKSSVGGVLIGGRNSDLLIANQIHLTSMNHMDRHSRTQRIRNGYRKQVV